MVTIRRATLLDRPSIEGVYATVAGTSLVLGDDEWRRWFSLGGILVAEENSRVIGFGGIDVTAEEQLRWMYLLPEFQRGGVGSRILDELETLAWSSGLQSIRLHSTPGAIQFYAKRGYTRVPDQKQLGHDHEGVEMVKLR
jgi:GNAT superfamily N-acetyltransferase